MLGKFLAAWAFIGIALALTFPIWITVNYLGSPDNGVIFAGYIGSFLMAGGVSRDRLVHLGGDAEPGHRVHPHRRRLLPAAAGRASARARFLPGERAADGSSMRCRASSFLTHFTSISKGVIDLRDLIYFLLMIGGLAVRERRRPRLQESGLRRDRSDDHARPAHSGTALIVLRRAVRRGDAAGQRRVPRRARRSHSRTISTRCLTAPGSMLQAIDEPINLYLFFSTRRRRTCPACAPMPCACARCSRRFAARAPEGKLELTSRSACRSPKTRIAREQFGLQSATSARPARSIYFGLAGTNSDRHNRSIPFFQPDKEAFLEYDVGEAHLQARAPEEARRRLAFEPPIAAGFDPQTRQMREPWAVVEQARQLFDVRTLQRERSSRSTTT